MTEATVITVHGLCQNFSAYSHINNPMANHASRPSHSREPHPGRELLPTWERLGPRPQWGRVQTWKFYYGIAAICGIIITLIFSPLSPRLFRFTRPPRLQCSAPPFDPEAVLRAGYIRPGSGQYVVPYEDCWSLESLLDMVSQTKGYYARDYSVWLGWNNVRTKLPLQPRTHTQLSGYRCAIS